MNQNTSKEQTQRLIELGFPEPKSVSEVNYFDTAYTTETELDYAYSIGELIEFLGMHLMGIHLTTIYDLPIKYVVQYKRDYKSLGYVQIQGELIDKLYDACVELKTEGII